MTAANTRISESARATEAIGAGLGGALRRGDLIALHGDIGAGKTCLVRGLAAGCGVDSGIVRSPTFVFHHVYPGPRLTVHHIDCYRLGENAELGFLDLDALLDDGAVAIEWANLAELAGYRPITLTIAIVGGEGRAIVLAEDAPERFVKALGVRP